MFKKVVSSLALAAVLAAPVAAQDVVGPVNFEFTNPGIPSDYDTYTGSINGGADFQVWCVTPNRFVTNPDNFQAYVTHLSGSDFTKTFSFQNTIGTAPASYLSAARYASLIEVGHSYSDAQVEQIQGALWYAMGYDSSADPRATLANYNLYAADAALAAIDPTEWYVISDVNGWGENSKQEFLRYVPNPPQEVVPEPATMTLLATGLAGMAAARRRRKQQG